MTWRALVLGGGGARGEFQVGALQALVERYERFDFHVGVSVGALNASVLAQHERLDQGVERLTEIWDGVRRDRDVIRAPLFGLFGGLVGAMITRKSWARDAIFDSTPLRRLIEEHVRWEDLEGKANWAVGVASLTDGEHYLVSNDPDLLRLWQSEHPRELELTLEPEGESSIPPRATGFVLASASIPLTFPPVDLCGQRFVDGGLRDVTPLSAAFDAYRCRVREARRAGAPPVDGEIVVISCLPTRLGRREQASLDSGIEILERAMALMTHEILENDLKEARWRNDVPRDENHHLRVLDLRPKRDPGVPPLGFGRLEERARLRAHGFEVAGESPIFPR